MEQILIVEDDSTLNSGLCQALKDADRQIVSCESIQGAREQLALGMVTLVILGAVLIFLKKSRAAIQGFRSSFLPQMIQIRI